MDLFGNNTDIEGADTLNACYGGTNALLNAVHWVESKSWDGRYALVVASDVAVYEAGPARPTGGCAAIVMLVGPDAPLVLETGLRGTHVENAYDFYKPLHDKEYAVVDGKLSIKCYLRALDICYEHYSRKFRNIHKREFSLNDADYFIFHSPYNNLVQKSVGRLMFLDFLRDPSDSQYQSEVLQKFKNSKKEETYFDQNLSSAFLKVGIPFYKKKVEPGILLPTELGNVYCASLYASLLSLIDAKQDELIGKRVALFSYGSGALATLFSIRVTKSVSFIAKKANLAERLKLRLFLPPEEFTQILSKNEERYISKGYVPTQPLTQLFPGAFYLEKVDKYRRFYKCLPEHKAKL